MRDYMIRYIRWHKCVDFYEVPGTNYVTDFKVAMVVGLIPDFFAAKINNAITKNGLIEILNHFARDNYNTLELSSA